MRKEAGPGVETVAVGDHPSGSGTDGLFGERGTDDSASPTEYDSCVNASVMYRCFTNTVAKDVAY